MKRHETLTKSKIKKNTACIVFLAEITANEDAIVIKENK
tara:strand:- start:111 stop:227 length:117 start_codon:yes stop_codon:yes gene_type:complete